MKLKKIKPDHYIIVDDSEIKEGDYVYNISSKTIFQAKKSLIDLINSPNVELTTNKKITHSTPNVGGFSALLIAGVKEISLQEVKELIGEVDVEKKAEEVFPYKETRTDFATEECREIYKIGYNQALEDNKDKKYTEEDMKVAITQAFLSGLERLEDFERVQEMILDNIKPKTEWEVEFKNGKLKLV